MTKHTIKKNRKANANRDPITGEIGSHPVGTGLGAAAGGVAAGAVAGSVVGPVGTVIGAAAGAVVGGLAGKGVAEAIDPTVEEAYWSENYSNRDYVKPGETFDDYGPAYRFGAESFERSNGRTYEQSESDLERDWDSNKGASNLPWERARHASRDSWQRVSDAGERGNSGRDKR